MQRREEKRREEKRREEKRREGKRREEKRGEEKRRECMGSGVQEFRNAGMQECMGTGCGLAGVDRELAGSAGTCQVATRCRQNVRVNIRGAFRFIAKSGLQAGASAADLYGLDVSMYGGSDLFCGWQALRAFQCTFWSILAPFQAHGSLSSISGVEMAEKTTLGRQIKENGKERAPSWNLLGFPNR
jgi:hypothetical protein